MRERFEMLSSMDEYVGRFISNEWVRKKVLHQTEDEIAEIDAQIKRETGVDPDDVDINPDLIK